MNRPVLWYRLLQRLQRSSGQWPNRAEKFCGSVGANHPAVHKNRHNTQYITASPWLIIILYYFIECATRCRGAVSSIAAVASPAAGPPGGGGSRHQSLCARRRSRARGCSRMGRGPSARASPGHATWYSTAVWSVARQSGRNHFKWSPVHV